MHLHPRDRVCVPVLLVARWLTPVVPCLCALHVCATCVRTASDVRLTSSKEFEVFHKLVGNKLRSFVLQASSDADAAAWVGALSQARLFVSAVRPLHSCWVR